MLLSEMEAVHEALESTAVSRRANSGISQEIRSATKRDILNHRNYIIRFLDEVDPMLSIAEVRAALESYD